jgi:hypothetical protein
VGASESREFYWGAICFALDILQREGVPENAYGWAADRPGRVSWAAGRYWVVDGQKWADGKTRLSV